VAAYECVDRKQFGARLAEATKKAQKMRVELLARSKRSNSAFAVMSPAIIALNAWIETLDQVSEANKKPKTTVESTQDFAIGEVLRRAMGEYANKNMLRAWARIVDLTRPGSMQTTR
jgi:hypothetical protein